MYAVIKTGGKQYRVSHGDRIRVESLKAAEGDSVNLDEVLLIGEGDSVSVGSPTVSDASVSAKVLSHGRGKKVEIIKFRRRKHHRKQMGHRQSYTELEITGISGAGMKSSAPAPKAEAKPAKPAPAKEAAIEEAPKAPAADSDTSAAASAPAASAAASLKFLDAPNGEPDDLKKILGIGPVIEEQLNEMGIYHFQQIADFNQQDIDNVNEALAFPGRIERDEWVEQAGELASGGGGRQLKYLDAPNGEPDDLKKVSGIGPVIETKLNEMGIYHFSQIAEFTEKDIDLVNNAIDFPGRIERDEWLDQARNLADGGEPR